MLKRVVATAVFLAALAAAAFSAEAPKPSAVRPLIIGGTDARIEDFPYQVLLAYISADHQHATTCGGSTINASWVLTAAHCIHVSNGSPNPEEYTVFTGASKMPDDGTPNDVAKIFIHPKFNRTTLENDIALVKLTQPLQQVSAVRVAAPGTEVSGNVTVTGFGKISDSSSDNNKQLKKATLPVVANSVCSDIPVYRGKVLPTMMCAGFLSGSPVTCDGDSGGPVTTEASDWTQRSQVGIVSFGGPSALCAVPNEYDVYTRVSEYVDWLAATVLQDDAQNPEVHSLAWLHPALELSRMKLVVAASRDEHLNFHPEVAQEIIKTYISPHNEGRFSVATLLRRRGLYGKVAVKSVARDLFHDVILFQDGTVIAIQYLGDWSDVENGSDDRYPGQLSNIAEVGARKGVSYAFTQSGRLITWDSVTPEMKRRNDMMNCAPDC